jgi:hypothetical protein
MSLIGAAVWLLPATARLWVIARSSDPYQDPGVCRLARNLLVTIWHPLLPASAMIAIVRGVVPSGHEGSVSFAQAGVGFLVGDRAI